MSTIAELPESPQMGRAEIGWRVWPLRQRPLTAMLVVLGFVAVGVLIHFVLGSPVMVLVGLIGLGLAGWRFFVPIDFTVDDGVKQRWFARRRYDDWNAFRAFSPLAHGFILWPRDNCCPLDAVRSLFLPSSRDKAELLVLLRRHLVELPAAPLAPSLESSSSRVGRA